MTQLYLSISESLCHKICVHSAVWCQHTVKTSLSCVVSVSKLHTDSLSCFPLNRTKTVSAHIRCLWRNTPLTENRGREKVLEQRRVYIEPKNNQPISRDPHRLEWANGSANWARAALWLVRCDIICKLLRCLILIGWSSAGVILPWGGGSEGGGLGGLNREVCRAQLFTIQSGAVFANTWSAEREGGIHSLTLSLTHGRTDEHYGLFFYCSLSFSVYIFVALLKDRSRPSSPCSFFFTLKVQLNLFKNTLGKMDVLPMCSIFQELQIVHDTGYFSALPSLEEYWQQVNIFNISCLY